MTKETFREAEIRRLNKMLKFRLPHYFFRLGISLFLIAFAALLLFKFLDWDMDTIRPYARNSMLIGLLFCSLAKDKIEDEMTFELRAKSYSLAFIFGVCWALVMPYVDYFIDVLLKSEAIVKPAEVFPTLIFMLAIQVMFYHTFKRTLQ